VDTRTYIASIKISRPAALRGGHGGAQQKQAAVNRIHAAEGRKMEAVVPRLEELRASGLISRFDFIPLTGTVAIDVPESRVREGWQALRAIPQIGRIVRDRPTGIDDAIDGAEHVRLRPGAASRPALVAHPPGASDPPAPFAAWPVERVGADRAWAAGASGEGVTIGFVDSGVDAAHPLLRAQYRGARPDGSTDHSYAFFDAVNARREAYDDRGHGTMVVGAAVGGTAAQPLGTAPGAKYMVAKVFSAEGKGSLETTLRGLSWMLEPSDSNGQNPDATKAPDIVSASFGARDGSSLKYLNAWKAFDEAGIITVAAAGNGGPRPGTINAPGSYPQSITVGASTATDQVWAQSGRGPSPILGPDGKPLAKPDVVAPGVDVPVAFPGGTVAVANGTSISTPMAAGVVAILKGRDHSLNAARIKDVLARSSVDLGPAGWDTDSGHGRIDAAAALAEVNARLAAATPAAV